MQKHTTHKENIVKQFKQLPLYAPVSYEGHLNFCPVCHRKISVLWRAKKCDYFVHDYDDICIEMREEIPLGGIPHDSKS